MSVTTFTTNQEINKRTPDDIGAFEGVKKVLKMYHIHHCINKLYMFTEKENQPRKYIGYVYAENLEDAYRKAQNEDWQASEYKGYKVRSTSIGDLIQDDYGFYMVLGQGFKLICLIEDKNVSEKK